MLHQLLCLFVLFCAPQYDGITEWGTKYKVDPVRYEAKMLSRRDCMVATFDNPYSTPEVLRKDIATCVITSENLLKDDDVYVFFADPKDKTRLNWFEFDDCSSQLGYGMWDIPDGTTVDQFRESVGECIEQYPGLPHIHYQASF